MRKIHFIILCIIAMLAISCSPGKEHYNPDFPFIDTVVPPNNPPIIIRDGAKMDSLRNIPNDKDMKQIKDTQVCRYMIDLK